MTILPTCGAASSPLNVRPVAEPLRYGQRRVSRMLAEVNAHRAAVRSGDPDATEATWEKLEQWLDLSMLSLLATAKDLQK